MTRRQGYPLNNAKYCADNSDDKKELHDLDNEKPLCRIDALIESGCAIPFDTLTDGYVAGYHKCSHCIGDTLRRLQEEDKTETVI